MAVDISQFSPDLQEAYRRLLEIYGGTLPAIKSGYRDPATNKSVGGAKGSQHLHGNAIDWATSGMSQEERLNFLNAARQAGFQGFGGYSSGNVHTDVGPARYWGDDYSGKSAPDWLKSWYSGAQPESATRKTDMSMNPNAPQRTGLLGFFDLMREPDPTTGMTAMERFGAALDPLVAPEQRMGEQFRASGAQRLQTQSRNRTIETLKQRAAAGDLIARDVLSGLESGAYDAKTAMSLYLGKRFETSKDDRTTQIKNYEYWLAQGKTPQEAEALVKSGGINIGSQEKEYEKTMGAEYAKRNIALSQEAQNAVKTLQTINIQENLIQDPSFRSGQGQALFDAASGFLSRFGIGEADLASNTAFQAFARQSVLDQLGGSLGTGVSNADVSFINGTVANLENTGESIALLLGIKKKVAERQLKVAEIARQWKSDNNTQYLDDRWDAYLAQWSQENPIFPDADSYL